MPSSTFTTTPTLTIDTGEARSVSGHAVSGAVATGVIAGVSQVSEVKNGTLDKKSAVQNTAVRAVQGGIATAAAISVANTLGNPQKSAFAALGTLALGAGAIFALEKLVKDENKG
ncbi:MAG: hypothetical protein K0U47_02900 [Epsilonproteobacteria bacterium]|nr:hypothetical protein [Campylobacterota bacterium]